jgi:NADH-quinone oxidoreductase subunit G
MPKITIDNEVYEAAPGKKIIEVADEVGIQIPRYCYHPDIGVEGSCRMCLVEVEKAPKLMPSCATPIADGMVVRTTTPRVQQAVRYAMEFLLLHHPIDCPVCDQSGECWLQDYYMERAGHTSRYPGTDKTRRVKAQTLGPLVKLDRERCILCTRCVRFTRNVTGTNEIGVFNRGHHSEIAVHGGKPFDNPYSANVVDICPVGALTNSDFRFKSRVWFLTGVSSVCAGCSTGCNLRIDHTARATGGGISGYTATEGKIYRTVGRRNVDVNKSWLCDEGRLSFHSLESNRLTVARTSGGEATEVSGLLAAAHQRFEAIRSEHGETAVAALASATNTNEALFLMKRYFRGQVDFRLGREVENYRVRQDDLLRRVDKHPNTQGALDLSMDGLDGLAGLVERARSRKIRGMWISFHPQTVGEDPGDAITGLEELIRHLEFSVVSSTHETAWASGATIQLPMAAWSEEMGTYTNYDGRVQITNRAVAPQGDAAPLHTMMAELLALGGTPPPSKPNLIFEALAREVAAYAGLDYDTIGTLGAARRASETPVAEEVTR